MYLWKRLECYILEYISGISKQCQTRVYFSLQLDPAVSMNPCCEFPIIIPKKLYLTEQTHRWPFTGTSGHGVKLSPERSLFINKPE